MDGAHFDDLTQRMTARLSRRRGVGLLAALGIPGLFSLDDSEARKKKKKKKKACPPCRKRKKGKCKKRLPDGTACPEGTCQGGNCVSAPPIECLAGKKSCGTDCIPSNQCCTNDDCPAASTTCCSGECLDTGTDPINCGSCGTRCRFGEQCVAGRCTCPLVGGDGTCDAGFTCCTVACRCTSAAGKFIDTVICERPGPVDECLPGTTPCVGTTDTCPTVDGIGPSRVCCPRGTTCTADGDCRL